MGPLHLTILSNVLWISYTLSSPPEQTTKTKGTATEDGSSLSNDMELEDGYIKSFGNTRETQFWDMARSWNLEYKEPRLKRFCTEAHKQAGYDGTGGANNTNVRPRILTFMNPNYVPRMVDIVMYGINGVTDFRRDRFYFWMSREDFWYITEGERDDCVYYVTHANLTAHNHEFKLVKHVCGIFINLELRQDVAYF